MQTGRFPRSPGGEQGWLSLLQAFQGPKVWSWLQLSYVLLGAPGPAKLHPC